MCKSSSQNPEKESSLLKDSPFNKEYLRRLCNTSKSKVRLSRTEIRRLDHEEECRKHIIGIRRTHSRRNIPDYNSGDSLYYFKSQEGESVFIEELKPPDDFLPLTRRISIKDAKILPMKLGGFGYKIIQVRFHIEKGGHFPLIICMKRLMFERTTFQ